MLSEMLPCRKEVTTGYHVSYRAHGDHRFRLSPVFLIHSHNVHKVRFLFMRLLSAGDYMTSGRGGGFRLMTESNAERLATSLCSMRGAALKLGQADPPTTYPWLRARSASSLV